MRRSVLKVLISREIQLLYLPKGRSCVYLDVKNDIELVARVNACGKQSGNNLVNKSKHLWYTYIQL